MDAEKITRINALARKARESGLTPEEEEERRRLREEYIAAFRRDLQATLDNVYVTDEQGRQVKIRKKEPPRS